MIRGTTPTITMELPRQMLVADIDEAVFSIAQEGKEIIQKRLGEMEPDLEKNRLRVSLSQEDTLNKVKDGIISMQLKVKVGEDVTASEIVTTVARKILNEDVI